jgi:hypothetical protein
MTNYALVAVALILVVVSIIIGGVIIALTPEPTDFETRKLRFAAATFTGILLLIIFACVLYFVADPNGAGKEIFDKLVPALTPIAGAIVGYLFAARSNRTAEQRQKGAEKKVAVEKPAGPHLPADDGNKVN